MIFLDPGVWIVIATTLLVIGATVLLHYELLLACVRLLPPGHGARPRQVMLVIFVILIAHVIAIWMFGLGYYYLAGVEQIGGVAGVTEGATKILGAIPGLELVDLEQPRVGYMCNSLAPVPAYKRELHARELVAAAAAGVDYLVGIYHACHRELCAHEATSPFKVVNFLELVGEAMGVTKPDLFKQWKMMQDIDRILAEVATHAAAAGLDLESVREVLLANMLGEQPLPIDFRGKPPPEPKAAPVRVIAE